MFLIHIYHMSIFWQVPLLCPYVRSPRPSLDSERRHQALARQGGQVPHWGVMRLVQLDRDGTQNLSRSQAFPGHSKVLIGLCHTRRSQLVLNFYEWGTLAELVESCDVLPLDSCVRTFENDGHFCWCFSDLRNSSVSHALVPLGILCDNIPIYAVLYYQNTATNFSIQFSSSLTTVFNGCFIAISHSFPGCSHMRCGDDKRVSVN